MGKKVTLNIDDELFEFAHEYSKTTHQSISHIVENYFRELKGTGTEIQLSSKNKPLEATL